MAKTQNFQRKDISFARFQKICAKTVSHPRFRQEPIEAPYLISNTFIVCHFFKFLENEDMLSFVKNGAKFLLNSPYSKDEVWYQLPHRVQEQLIEKNIRFFVIDANEVAKKQECEAELIPL